MFKLKNKVAIVTGASRGIGRSVAQEISKSGAHVVCVSRSEDDLLKISKKLNDEGFSSSSFVCDVSNSNDFKKLIDDTVSKFNQVDILVNNAGITKDNLIMRMSESDWNTVIDVNLKGVFNGIKAVSRQMMKQKYGRIINISSVAAFAPYTNSGGMYIATKLMLLKFSEMIHNDYKSKNIFSCSVCPGFTHTEFHKDMKEFKSSIPSFMWMDSRTVVEQAYEASMSGKEIIINGWRYKILVFLMKITPKWLVKVLSGR